MTVQLRAHDLLVRELATAKRLAPFRGTMCDIDFAKLVADVLRIRDKSDGRFAVSPLAALAETPLTV